MITIFNRKELIFTYSMEQQAQIRSLLAANNIPYYIKTDTGTNTVFGSGHGNPTVSCQYRIYVHKDDYDRSVGIINLLGEN